MSRQKTGTIYLTTASAAAIFEQEVKGQLSDGMWENAAPEDHWEFWSGLEVKRGLEGEDRVETDCAWRCKKTGYNIAGLYEYVGERMLAIGRFARATQRVDSDRDGAYLEHVKDMTDFILKRQGSDWIASHLNKISFEDAEEYFLTDYDMSDLRADVRRIKKAMKTVKQ